ncbi:ABC-type bacteriocin/lantibiotic exporter with double-glycine peptidase domain [Nocardia goodfellowii]|uniref:ABC-type bacteriocin/lantibiotic exporter with double-glycine peptidase domain n=1 Tax=Nocardia goodfellowii TaxID=882446 RepID=A0ABS4QD97_9NOCA|nr:ABC-type bacteriocin/lantibiotic exporter with double-glycine peptidase domain [Nocardia goodfellowii]
MSHFVVLEKATRSHIVIVDPAVGRRNVSWDEADIDFTGVALEFSGEVAIDCHDSENANQNEAIEIAKSFLPRSVKWMGILTTSGMLLLYGLIFPLLLGNIVTKGADAARSTASEHLLLAAALLCGIISFGLLNFVRSRLIVSIQSLLEERAGHLLMAHLNRLPIDFFAARHPGDLVQRVRSVARLKLVISATTVSALFDTILVVGYVVVIGYWELWLSLVVVGCIVGFLLITALSWRRQRQLSSDVLEARTKSSGELSEILANMTTVKALGAENIVQVRWLNLFANELTAGTRQRRHAATISSLVVTLQFAAPLLVLLVAVSLTANGSAGLSAAVSLGVLSSGLFFSMSNLSQVSTTFAELTPDLRRMNDILTSSTERRGIFDVAQASRPPIVRLENVSYTYAGATTASVCAATAEVPSGGLLAVLGASGSGKSTLGMLLGGLLIPRSGRILIDGVDLTDLDPVQYRKRIGYIDQSSTLMSGSIIDNIRFACPEASLDEIREAARLAEIDDFICALPMKYETVLGAGGAGVSGGQRQRIVLARALVKAPSLLILDESTSAVDPDTESKILRNIQTLGVTTIVLGHRAALAVGASGILTMTKGIGEFKNVPASSSPLDERVRTNS